MDDAYMISLIAVILQEFILSFYTADDHEKASDAEEVVQYFWDGLPSRGDRDWTLEEMTATCGLRRSQFSELLKVETGDSPIHYLNRIRTHRACELLKTTKSTIKEISEYCGFNSTQYFANVFKSYMNQPPSFYRNNLKSSFK